MNDIHLNNSPFLGLKTAWGINLKNYNFNFFSPSSTWSTTLLMQEVHCIQSTVDVKVLRDQILHDSHKQNARAIHVTSCHCMNYECQAKVSKSFVSPISKTSKRREKYIHFFGNEQAIENMCAMKSTQDMWRPNQVVVRGIKLPPRTFRGR